MSKRKVNKFVKRPVAAVASLMLCLCLTGVTVLAATGKLQGFFKDVKRWDGAVIGTTYEQATDEIEVKITEITDELILEISMIDPGVAPYSFFEMFGVESYKILDVTGKVIEEVDDAIMTEVTDGKSVIHISLDGIAEGEYKLIVDKMVGSSKADQPLALSGTWEIVFVK